MNIGSPPQTEESFGHSLNEKTSKKIKKKKESKVDEEIKRLRESTKLVIPRKAFERYARELLRDCRNDFRFQPLAVDALQEAAENVSVQLFEDSLLCANHRQRKTLCIKDMHLVSSLSGSKK
ncbi:uncharacterized protein LOC129571781 [Sitodiplosis mosellana]|uniref:uncharacterized protein LOC129571781 n=1 Tax=Sitodiplosis mosellana TaxID=263140 RepID=UPI002444B764|nr:uncharacterized protein LOC129571781 [Sitodiplosis mosellana]